ncbi:hypothetical protein E2C01_021951 [Portunus trituberculatus]|uniref:Uncharacterized protein n=1 Tax=Portunus trituberculatus TaxID=210409 RepID=A0A5B7E449_PORTR|nr:hypothetical protein [Portunus trituberculatus]
MYITVDLIKKHIPTPMGQKDVGIVSDVEKSAGVINLYPAQRCCPIESAAVVSCIRLDVAAAEEDGIPAETEEKITFVWL